LSHQAVSDIKVPPAALRTYHVTATAAGCASGLNAGSLKAGIKVKYAPLRNDVKNRCFQFRAPRTGPTWATSAWHKEKPPPIAAGGV